MANRHWHHTIKAPSLPDIHLPTGEWDLEDVEAAIDDLKEIKAKMAEFLRCYSVDLSIFFGASTDTAGILAFINEGIDQNLIFPMEQVADTIVDNDGGRRWYEEHSTYRTVAGRVA